MGKEPKRGWRNILTSLAICAFIALIVVASAANLLGLVGGGYGKYNTEFHD